MNKEIEVLQGVCDGIAKNQYAGRFGTMGIHDCPACKRKWCKGLWAKIPAEGTTTVTKPTLQGQDEAGKNIWQDVKTEVPNRDLKAMVEAYKTRAPQEKAAEHRESARDKLDALAKETAAKVSIDKPKKTKTKAKGPEL